MRTLVRKKKIKISEISSKDAIFSTKAAYFEAGEPEYCKNDF